MKTPHTTTTIYLDLEEDIICDVVIVSAPHVGKDANLLNAERKDLAAIFGFARDGGVNWKAIPNKAGLEGASEEGVYTGCDYAALDARIIRIATKHGATVTSPRKGHWVVTRHAPVPTTVPSWEYVFPDGSFSGFDQVKYGPTDFYYPERKAVLAAIHSGLNFTTPWLSCKKEILSSRISRIKNTLTVKVSVSDDSEGEGEGEASRRVEAATFADDEKVLKVLEKLGAKAWTAANQRLSEISDSY